VSPKAQFRMTLMVVVLAMGAMTLPRLWAQRHATHNDWTQLPADAINVAI
jgi:hypothetical protein